MKIEETETSVIIDGYEIEGYIDKERNCHICNAHLVFFEDYDAYFCPYCNSWTEKKCPRIDIISCYVE
jgi:hypothetical protein